MKNVVLASAMLVLSAVTASAAAKAPRDFIDDAIRGDNSEIMLGRLAERAAGTDQVKEFGRILVKDHTKAKRQAVEVAHELGVQPSSHAMMEADAEYAKLQLLSGTSFDKEFDAFMVRDHQDDVAAFRAEADSDPGPAGKLARKQLPTLNKHLQMAQSLMAMDKSAAR
jgi:putative membrane protein